MKTTTHRVGVRDIRFIDAIPPGYIFDLQAAQEEGRAVTGLRKILPMLIVEEDRHLFDEALYDAENILEMSELTALVQQLVEANSNRPTRRPSGSRAGGAPTLQQSRVVSLSRGTAPEDEASQTDGASIAS